jgi:membrane fusion protein (multidrug efflux system)
MAPAQRVAESPRPHIVEAPSPEQKPEPGNTPAATEAKPPRKRGGRRLVLMIALPLVLAVGGGWFWLTGGRYVETDNAYVEQAKLSISPDVAGRIVAVAVSENQPVKAGDVLFKIDPQPYQIGLDQANAALASARLSVQQQQVGYQTAQSKLDAAQSALEIEQRNFDRTQSLAKQGLTAQTALDTATNSLQAAQTAVSVAQQAVASASAALGGKPKGAIDEQPAVLTALAAVETAQRNLSKTTVVAPADGVISQVSSLNVGQFVATGTMIASLVETDQTWVEANFKETQLTGIVAGQPVEVTVDAYASKLEGKVASIGAATGSEFSLIPAQNATGNWVKVVQRIPVRIELSPVDAGVLDRLRSGMSANVSVDTGHTTLDQMLGK